MATLTPASASRLAAQPPEAPEPTTTTSNVRPATSCMLGPPLRGTYQNRDDDCGLEDAVLTCPAGETRVSADKKLELPMVHDGVGRRELLQGLFAGVGASVALPAAAAHEHSPAAVAEAQAKAKAPDWKPEFLDAHQLATLGVLCAHIVPGSEKALADRFIDSLLAVESRERQGRFMNAMGALERVALERFQKPFKALSAAQQVELLQAAAAGDSSRKEWIWKPGELVQPPEEKEAPPTLRDHFDHIKGRIVDAYYSSEAGLKELGATGQMFFTEFPDCKHPEHL